MQKKAPEQQLQRASPSIPPFSTCLGVYPLYSLCQASENEPLGKSARRMQDARGGRVPTCWGPQARRRSSTFPKESRDGFGDNGAGGQTARTPLLLDVGYDPHAI